MMWVLFKGSYVSPMFAQKVIKSNAEKHTRREDRKGQISSERIESIKRLIVYHVLHSPQVLIGHIMKKMNKQTFPEYCSLCKEVLPFTDRKQAVCNSGHIWLR